MTLKNKAMLFVSTLFLAANIADARPGGRPGGPGGPGRGGGHHGGGYNPRPQPPRAQPPRPIPPRPVPPRPAPMPIPPRYPNPGPEVVIPASVFQRVVGQGVMFDVGRYFNLSGYYNYRIAAVEIQAQPNFGQAGINVMVNSQPAGSIMVDAYRPYHVVYPNNARIGVGITNVVFFVSGDVTIQSVTLRLSAY
ncbi:MAG: hypothetical protein KF802_10395 [Bdellovibrionaceae bacterium]|nr:hypothetical protein [Pseudobdellovibrionaceae bacterium]MBX3033819.1 hypothetical protein [Pseudobdellovibrionaceae bacterium]